MEFESVFGDPVFVSRLGKGLIHLFAAAGGFDSGDGSFGEIEGHDFFRGVDGVIEFSVREAIFELAGIGHEGDAGFGGPFDFELAFVVADVHALVVSWDDEAGDFLSGGGARDCNEE